MEIEIMCESCETIAVFPLYEKESKADIHSLYKKYSIGVSWENVTVVSAQEELLTAISRAASHKEQKGIIENHIKEYALTKTLDSSPSFICRKCGDRLL